MQPVLDSGGVTDDSSVQPVLDSGGVTDDSSVQPVLDSGGVTDDPVLEEKEAGGAFVFVLVLPEVVEVPVPNSG